MGRRRVPAEQRFLDSLREDPGGCLTWIGALSTQGYGRLNSGDTRRLAHRYAWERVHGPIPPGMSVDHACHNTACCNVEHLRLATHAQNMRNRNGAHKNSKTGVRGVSFHKGRYRVRVRINGSNPTLGWFDSLAEATAAAERAREEAYGEFAGK